jgi:hypothetical protein
VILVLKEVISDYFLQINRMLKDAYEVKEGDLVLVGYSNWGSSYTNLKIDKVKKITPTGQIKLERRDGIKFKGCYQMSGDVWGNKLHLYVYDEKVIEIYKKINDIKAAKNLLEENIDLLTEEEVTDLAIKICKRMTKKSYSKEDNI